MTQDILQLAADMVALAQKAGADAADAMMVEHADISVSYRLGVQEDLERAESKGLGLRVFVGKKNAIVSTSDFSTDAMRTLCEQAVAIARASMDDPFTELAEHEAPESNLNLDLCDSNEPNIQTLQHACLQTEDAARSHAGITNSEGAQASYGRSTLGLVTSRGFVGSYQASSASLSVSVIGGEGDTMQRDYDYATKRFWADLPAPETIGHSAAERTLQKLNPKKIESQALPIVFDPRVGRSLLANFASAISGSTVARGTSFLKGDLHKEIFANNVEILDDARRARGLGSRPFDGEGMQSRAQHMVKDGALQSWFLDSRSAKQLGLKRTAHATRGLASQPHPSSTNLYMKAGSISRTDMLKDIARGLYITEAFGMGVNLVTGDYSQGASGFMIENGELTYPVSEITIAGHLREMFLRMTPANDLEFRYATNVPTLRVDGMMIAGT